MLTGKPARRAVGGLLVLAIAGVGPVLAAGQPALADSVRGAQQWVLDAVDAPSAWPETQGSGVLVAVIDSGVRPDVSDLAGSVTSGPDLSGVGTPTSDANWGMHGTWMASLIAGHGHGPGGGDGIIGVAPQAKILSIRVLPDKKDPGYPQYKHQSSSRGQHALAQAIRYAVAHHASVISMSLGYGASSRVVRAALQDATRHGVVVVASSGNSGTTASDDGKAHAPYSFPADYPGVLGVAAVDRSGSPAPFSSDNLSVQIAAPGVKVPAQGSDGQYWLVSGTSPACALTAGVAALIKSLYPHLAPALVIRAITISAQNQPKQGYDDRVGFGTLDAEVALTTAHKLTGFGVTGRGISAGSHFGGGPKAIPPAPVGPRGTGQLLLFGGLALACLIVSLIAAGRLILYRRHTTPAGPAYPAYPAPAPARPAAQWEPVQPDPAQLDAGQVGAGPASAYPAAPFPPGPAWPASRPPEPSQPAAQPPASPTTAWWSQDNGIRPPDPAPAPGQNQADRTPAGPWPLQLPPLPQPEPPRTEPHPIPSSGWPSSSLRAEAVPPPADPAATAGPAAPQPATTGAPSPGGAIPDWPTATPPHAQIPWPDDDHAETTSPSGFPPVRAESAGSPPAGPPPAAQSLWPSPNGSPSAGSPSPGAPSADELRSAWPSPDGPPSAAAPSGAGPVRPGSTLAGSAGPSRYLQGLGRPSAAGRHAARREQPQPTPAWAANRPPGSQDNDSEDPDPQDEA